MFISTQYTSTLDRMNVAYSEHKTNVLDLPPDDLLPVSFALPDAVLPDHEEAMMPRRVVPQVVP